MKSDVASDSKLLQKRPFRPQRKGVSQKRCFLSQTQECGLSLGLLRRAAAAELAARTKRQDGNANLDLLSYWRRFCQYHNAPPNDLLVAEFGLNFELELSRVQLAL